MKASFKLDAKRVKQCSINLEKEIDELKNDTLLQELKQFDNLDSTLKLLEELSIINEYKLNLFKDFSSYNIRKK